MAICKTRKRAFSTGFYALLVLFGPFRLLAQPVPIVQEFFLPMPENQVLTALTTIFPNPAGCNRPASPMPSAPIRTYISLSPYLNGTIIYYDQWEDGFETELTRPTQATTQIWGDNNPANGIPPGFATDLVQAGRSVLLSNNINPANMAFLDFDGGDRIGTSNPLGVTKSNWATGSETLLAGDLLAYPTSEWGNLYVVPMGQDVFTAKQSYSYTGFSIMASRDGTSVRIDANADGVFEKTITLNRGQSHQENGGVMKGARVVSSLPIQMHVIAGDVCDNYESRWYVMPPFPNWGNYYFGPTSGLDKEFHLYNPNTTSITIKIQNSSGNLPDIVIPPNSVASVAGQATSGLLFYSNDGSPFAVWALSDASNGSFDFNKSWDWGAMLLPYKELTQQAIIGFAPGQDPNFPIVENSSPVWVTVGSPPGNWNQGNVQLCIDFDGDGIGAQTDSYGRQYDQQLTIKPLSSQKVYDPDGDQTNMLIYICDGSQSLVSAVWGEDAATANPASPGLDMGTGVPGINPFYAYKGARISFELFSIGTLNLFETVEYKIGITNEGLVPTTGTYTVSDLLPANVSYVNNSTSWTKGAAVTAIADGGGGTNFPLDNGGYNLTVSLNPGEEAFITFRVLVVSKPAPDGCFTNYATISKGSVSYTPSVTLCVVTPPENCTSFFDEDGDGLNNCDDPDCFAVTAGASSPVCIGGTINLTASGGTTYAWSGPASFTSSLQNPTRSGAILTYSGNYVVTISNGTCTTTRTVQAFVQNCAPPTVTCASAGCTDANLIPQGSFENSTTDAPAFSSDLLKGVCGYPTTSNFFIVQSAQACGPSWPAAPDKTFGNGNGKYLAVDFSASTTAPDGNANGFPVEIACFQNVAVTANADYCFSAWLMNLCSACATGDMKFTVNGVTVGTVSGGSLSTGGWTKSGFSFNMASFGNPATINICIAQNNAGDIGYDLAVDDVELRRLRTGTTPVLQNDFATACSTAAVSIPVLTNDAGAAAATLAVSAAPPVSVGTVAVSGSNLLFTPATGFTGQAVFSYTACDAVGGCCSAATVTVTVAPISATAINDSPICAGASLDLTASGGNSYSWTGPNSFTATGSYVRVNPATLAAAGTYTVTVTNAAGCTATATTTATVTTCAGNRSPECNCN